MSIHPSLTAGCPQEGQIAIGGGFISPVTASLWNSHCLQLKIMLQWFWFRSILLNSLLNPLPALHLADHFDISSVRPQCSPHVFDILGVADEAGEHNVYSLGYPKPQVGLVSLADCLQANQVAAGEVNAFTTAQQPTGLHHRIHPVRAWGGKGVKENNKIK